MSFAERRGRFLSVVLLLAGGGMLLLGSTQPWLHAHLSGAELPVSGADAIPVLQPLALAVLALALVLSLVGRVLRHILAALALLAGGVLIAMTAPVTFAPPLSAVESVVTEHSGLIGLEAVAELVTAITATAWPALSLAAAALVAVTGLFALLTAHRWKHGTRRYDSTRTVRSDGPVDAIDSWDDLSRGDDPTSGDPTR